MLSLGGYVPEFKVALWHGFNLPLLMSAIAVSGGIFMYTQRRYLYQFQASLPPLNAKKLFDRTIYVVIKWCQRKISAIENGSLQRYLMLMFASCITLQVGHYLK